MPSQSVLEQLFDATTLELIQRIQNGEASAADLGVAVKLLKDNNITVVIEDNEKMQDLKRVLDEKRRKRDERSDPYFSDLKMN